MPIRFRQHISAAHNATKAVTLSLAVPYQSRQQCLSRMRLHPGNAVAARHHASAMDTKPGKKCLKNNESIVSYFMLENTDYTSQGCLNANK